MKRWRIESPARGNRSFSATARPRRASPLALVSLAGLLGGLVAADRATGGTLQEEIRSLVSRSGLSGRKVAVAVYLEGKELAAAYQADLALKPASNQKILTTVAGIRALGIDHVYETTISSTAPLSAGTIDGDLIVRGTGDPNISGRFYDDDPTALFREWARRLRSVGLDRVTGDVVADDTLFDDERLPPSWDIRQENSWYSAQVSALNLNDNCLDFTVTPGPRVGAPAIVRWVPRTAFTAVSGEVKTVGKGDPAVGLYRKHGTNEIRVAGEIRRGEGSVWKGNVTVDDPALFFVTVLLEALREEGIAVEGKPRKVARDGAAPPLAPHLLVRHRSTLRRDLPIILKNSQNLHAEALLRAAGAKVAGEGSIAGGEKAVLAYLRSEGIDDRGIQVRDGSGLSHENRASAGVLARILREVRDEPYFEEYLRSLPVAGVDGTLRSRFKTRPHLRGRVFAKTGYIDGVSCLSGYVTSGEKGGGKVGCFSVLANDLREGTSGAKGLQEAVAEAVYRALGGR